MEIGVGTVTPRSGLRERRRQETVREIKAAALQLISQHTAAGFSLRELARELGITPQALYNYFDNREALLTQLIFEAHTDLAQAVQLASTPAHESAGPRLRHLRACHGYRTWALDQRARFLLIYGEPIPRYEAPDPGPTSNAARQLGAVFARVIFDHWTTAELDALESIPAPADLKTTLHNASALIAPDLQSRAFELLIQGWSRLHGLVMLEILGHVPWLTTPEVANEFADRAFQQIWVDLEQIRSSVPGVV